MDIRDEINGLALEFEKCRPVLIALGDENRQHLILELMRTGRCGGVRIGEITEKTNLSRPAVSHHVQILKRAGILKMRREGTKNYYYFDAEVLVELSAMLNHAADIKRRLNSVHGTERSDEGDA